MKIIPTHGITCCEAVPGSDHWFWGSDYAHGDLYEAEELFRDGHTLRPNRLIFLHAPEGWVWEPIPAGDDQCFGRPVFDNDQFYILRSDFLRQVLEVFSARPDREAELVLTLPRSAVVDCYNLQLFPGGPLLAHEEAGHRFHILWPQEVRFPVAAEETFLCRRGEKLYFSRWWEDPDYHEELVVRHWPSGEVMERLPGSATELPDGSWWLLQ